MLKIKSDKTEVKFYPYKLAENFYKIEKYVNIKVLICYNLGFDIERLKRNNGSYIIISISLLLIILMIINFFTSIYSNKTENKSKKTIKIFLW